MSARPFDDAIRHPTMRCVCAEGRYLDAGGVQRWAPPVHDCAYIAWRESLVPDAMTAALARCPKGTKDIAWTAEFLGAMDRETAARPFVAAKVAACLCGVGHGQA